MRIPKSIKYAARELRNNMTEAESLLWEHLRNDSLGFRFLRQKPVHVYSEADWFERFIIADFLCEKKNIIVEVDWDIHNAPEIYLLDSHKEQLLWIKWYTILRIKNKDIFTGTYACIKFIKSKL